MTSFMNFGENGIHQGGIVDVPQGEGKESEWWSIIFQDRGKLGRVPTLQPVHWKDGWPYMGEKGFYGQKAVVTYKKPNIVNLDEEINLTAPVRSDDFPAEKLGLQWQWNHNPNNDYWSLSERKGYIRLKTATVTNNLTYAQNTLTQRIVGPDCVGTVQIDIGNMADGDMAGLAVMQKNHNFIGIESDGSKKCIVLYDNSNLQLSEQLPEDINEIWFRAEIPRFEYCTEYSYSFDGKNFKQVGGRYDMYYGDYVGMRVGIFNYATKQLGGYVDVGSFKLITSENHGNLFLLDTKIDAERYDNQYFVIDKDLKQNLNMRTEETNDEVDKGYDLSLENLKDGDWITFDRIDFGSGNAKWFNARVASNGDGNKIEVHKDSIDGPLITTLDILNTGNSNTYINVFSDLSIVPKGVQKIVLVFKGDKKDLCKLNWFEFGTCRIPSENSNPLLPLDNYIPDVEAKVFTNSEGQERVYLYGSHDNFDTNTWCSHQYRVYSAPLANLNEWTDHGVSFASRKGEGYIWDGKDADGISWNDNQLYAPDVAKINDTYYLITCSSGGSCLGIAMSENPEGPFSPAKKLQYDDGTDTGSIDPSIYVDGEGSEQKIYLLWGQRAEFGTRGLLGAELTKDKDGCYTVVKRDTEKLLFGDAENNREKFGFYEGASLKKINGKYYILYPSDKGKGIHTMSYSIADEALGDYTFGGNILENDGCDLAGGNNHGSFCEINKQWYLFYHRGFGNSNYRRKVCVEKIYFDENGKIGDKNGNIVQMTNHGFGGPLNPYGKIEAAYATHVKINGFKEGCYLTEKSKDLHPLICITNGNCVEYKDFDFGQKEKQLIFVANVFQINEGSIDVILDDPNSKPVGTITVSASTGAGYIKIGTLISKITGIHTLYLKFNSDQTGNICELASFKFVQC